MYTNLTILLPISIYLLYFAIYKIDYKDPKQRLVKIIFIAMSVFGFPVSILHILNLDQGRFYEILVAVMLLVIMGLLCLNCWKIRNDPKVGKTARIGLGIMLFTFLYIIVVVILAQVGVFG